MGQDAEGGKEHGRSLDLIRCETCRYWKRVPPTVRHVSNKGGWCEHPRFQEDYGYEDDALVYSYQESGSFWTGRLFGCVHHEYP